MSIYFSRSFPRSNSSFFLSSGYASKSSVIRLREDKFLVDTGLGTPKIRMKDELTNVPQYRRTARFENKVGYSFNVVAGESTLKKRRNYERFFKDLVAGESRIKERAANNLNSFLGPLDVAAGEPLVLPRRFRQNLAQKGVKQILRTKRNNYKLALRLTLKQAERRLKGFLLNKAKIKKIKGYSVAIAGLIIFMPVFKKQEREGAKKKSEECREKRHLFTY